MALVTLPALKGLLGMSVSDTSQDAWLDTLRVGAEAAVKNYCGQEFEPQTRTEYHTGDGRRWFVLRQVPVSSITSLYVDDVGYFGTNPVESYPTETLLTEGVNYVLEREKSGVSKTGVVWRIDSVWRYWQPEARPGTLSRVYVNTLGNIKVTYISGYSIIPGDVQMAVAMLVAHQRKSLPIGDALVSERIGTYSWEAAGERMMGPLPVMGSVKQLLSPYRDVW